jgi:hypothetical protein
MHINNQPIQKEKIMNKLFKPLAVVTFIMLVAAACGSQAVQAKPVEQPSVASSYQALLGKSLDDKSVADFMARNYCSSAGQYQLCGSTGIALGMDPNQKVKTVFFFPGRMAGFAAFHGELPYGLHWEDNRAVVEQKLGLTPNAIYLNEAGLPTEIGTPDNIRLWVAYQEAGVIIVYNTLSGDNKEATIHAILVTN